ncbi:MAG: Holliday junction branch migration protein RuvA [Verrucomicrobiales bacterium]|jgi:Holliday junction DNA helicase RuvA|nr:Holliday junction branch migration protein RuvA [Verrucomicrobiales bacterium]MEC7225169.1 Holliday junction branch migration protein RuvA [Verrucomicrobiota bacterium]|tara:strand:- start:2233 stop:2832 length:600 start_codon:yes stop_codon:yes gene_type:complete
MITYLNGILTEIIPGRLTIDVNGIGYEVLVPLSTSDKMLEEGQKYQILTHLHIREQEQTLFGFATNEERDLFRLLINRVSGIGPKLGLAILSGMSVDDFKNAVIGGNITGLSTISGLGKKTAERIILELKDKVGVTETWTAAKEDSSGPKSIIHDAVLALISLGYKQAEALKAVNKIKDSSPADISSDELIRSALRTIK